MDTPESKTPYEYDASAKFLVALGDSFRQFQVLSVT
jgi:hypothetical protein